MSQSKITREIIAEFGNKLRNQTEITRVSIDVTFNDGTNISFDSGLGDILTKQ